MDLESEISNRSVKSNKSLLSSKSYDSSQTSVGTSTNLSQVESSQNTSTNESPMHFNVENDGVNNPLLSAYKTCGGIGNLSMKTNQTKSISWTAYNLTSNYSLLPSQMPPLPALPPVTTTASSPTAGVGAPNGGGTSSSSTYANTTASEESHPYPPLYTSKPQYITPSGGTESNYPPLLPPPVTSSTAVLSMGNHFIDPNESLRMVSKVDPQHQQQQQQQSGYLYNSNNNNNNNNNDRASVISATNTLVTYNQSPPFISQIPTGFLGPADWMGYQSRIDGIGQLIYPSPSSPGMGGYFGGPASEATGTTTLVGDESITSMGHSYMGWQSGMAPSVGGGSACNSQYYQTHRSNSMNNFKHQQRHMQQQQQQQQHHHQQQQQQLLSGQVPQALSDNMNNSNSNTNNNNNNSGNNNNNNTTNNTNSSSNPNNNNNSNHSNPNSRMLTNCPNIPTHNKRSDCTRTAATVIAVILVILAFFSPAVMVALPITHIVEWKNVVCDIDCESQLIALTIKLILIGAAAYLTFLRHHICRWICCRRGGNRYNRNRNSAAHLLDPVTGMSLSQSGRREGFSPITGNSTAAGHIDIIGTDSGATGNGASNTPTRLPRLTFLRSFLLFLTFIISVVFWLFYGIRLLDPSGAKRPPYKSAVSLANRLSDCLLLVHYLGLVIIVLREMTHETFAIKVVRSPDGVSKIYQFRKMSIQLAAIKVLRNYVVDFKVYNPFVEAPARRRVSSRAPNTGSSLASSGGRSSRTGISSLPSQGGSAGGTVDIHHSPATTYMTLGLSNGLDNGSLPFQPPPGALGGLARYKFYDVDGPAPMAGPLQRTPNAATSSPASLSKCPSHSRRKTASLKSFGSRSQRSCPVLKNGIANRGPTPIIRTSGSHNHGHRKSSTHTTINSCGGNNDRYYEEMEHEKRVAKRRVRLMLASEEAFRNLYRFDENCRNNTVGNAKPLDAYEAAQAMFSTLLRPLQKYLRTTRQQPRFSMEWVIGHLRRCLTHELGARVFLEPFLAAGGGPVLEDPCYQQQLSLDRSVLASWTLLSDRVVSRSICDGAVFQLCQGDVSLFCTVRALPNFTLSEGELYSSVSPGNDRFIFKLDSETSV